MPVSHTRTPAARMMIVLSPLSNLVLKVGNFYQALLGNFS
jgi:hypothetical protein